MYNIYAKDAQNTEWIHKKRHWVKGDAIMIADSLFETFSDVLVTKAESTETQVYRKTR